MNSAAITPTQETLMDRFGLKLAARLSEQPLPHDVSERLRVARQQALAQYKTQAQTQAASAWSMSGGAAALSGGEGNQRINWLLGALPLLALVLGLMLMNHSQNKQRAHELAEVDVQLLTDELPPSAHADPGFAHFLKFGPPQASSGE